MACPHFQPTEPRARIQRPQDAMLPLGNLWAGVCRADPELPSPPDDSVLLPLCNLGYARETCPRFGSATVPDAVRFTINRDDGARLGLFYVLERDHHPHAHGPLEFDPARDAFTDPPVSAILETQARAYIASYLRRKPEAFTR